MHSVLNDQKALDYLMNIRGFSLNIIKQQKLGLTKHYFKTTGKDTRALIYPYLMNGNQVWCHFRTLPDPDDLKKVPKDFASPAGWDSTLFNIECLKDGIKDVVLVEGEANCIAAMDHGIHQICGVPGANIKKAEWITKLDELGLEKIYVCYDSDKTGQRAAQTLASRIGIERCWKITLPHFMVTTEEGNERPGKDLNEWFTHGGTVEGFEQLKAEAELFDVDGVARATDALDEFTEELDGKGAGQKYVWPLISNIVQFDEGDCIDILSEEKRGKLLANSAKILLETGEWKLNGEIKLGDKLASIDGKESIVIGVYPQGLKNIYKVTFWDGRSVLAGAEHLWSVGHVDKWKDGGTDLRVFTTDSIRTGYRHRKGSLNAKLYIPRIDGNFGKNEVLPIPPYLLGALIGDGSITQSGVAHLHSVDGEIAETIRSKGVFVKYNEKSKNYWFPDQDWLRFSLIELGLAGTVCETKFIPPVYLKASREVRLELLRGLMDTDGTVSNKYGTPSYTTVSPQLAKDFQYLIRSLGGICKPQKIQKKKFRYKGELREGQPAYTFVPRLDDRDQVFALPRKAIRATKRVNFPKAYIQIN